MSAWRKYLGATFDRPNELDRARIELHVKQSLPDDYWQLAVAHQGQVLEGGTIDIEGEKGLIFGVLLLVINTTRSGENASYTVEQTFDNMHEYYPAGIIPFANDTGGNYWAFDYRRNATAPSVVFVDHDFAGEEGITHASDNFAAFMDRWSHEV